MKNWSELLETGRTLLYANRAHEAMNILRESLECCSTSEHTGMGEILFYLGIAFKKLGQLEHARSCWLQAFAVRDGSCLRDAESRLFHAIQLTRYLSRKKDFQFDTLAEGDMVHDLICATWDEITGLEELAEMSDVERVTYYAQITIIFPQIRPQPERVMRESGKIIPYMH